MIGVHLLTMKRRVRATAMQGRHSFTLSATGIFAAANRSVASMTQLDPPAPRRVQQTARRARRSGDRHTAERG